MAIYDFFISYTKADARWAEWIAWQLEESGYRVLFQTWDFVGGANWINSMQVGVTDSDRLIAVLSPDYLSNSKYGTAEWQAVWAQDPLGEDRKLLPVVVSPGCPRPGLLAGPVGCDLTGRDEEAAREVLINMVESAISGRAKPAIAPKFPGASSK